MARLQLRAYAIAALLLTAGGATAHQLDAAQKPWRLAYATEAPGRRGLDVYVVDVPGGKPVRVAGVAGRDDFSPSWSPDGKSIVFRRNPLRSDEGEVIVVRLAGRSTRNLTRTPRVADWSPVWSRSTIAYFSFPSGRGDIWLMAADGTKKRRLTRDGTLNEYPTFRPDGRRLAFQSHRDGNFDVYAIDRSGRNERRLTRNPASDKWPAWPPDGRLIAFVSERDGSEDVFVMRPDGTGVRNLTRTPALTESHPAWAPDGRLTFARHDDRGPVEIWVVAPDGTGAERLATTAEPVFTYDWQ